MARLEGLEPPTLWFEGSQGQNLNACSGVAYEHSDSFLILTMIPSET